MSIFETKVTGIGSQASLFKEEGMIILFGENAPIDLADYTYIISINPIDGCINPGMRLIIDSHSFLITAVGDLVGKNLENLGHITIKFDGSEIPGLPGTLYVENNLIPEIVLGSMLRIE